MPANAIASIAAERLSDVAIAFVGSISGTNTLAVSAMVSYVYHAL
jgi:hypothetical protein